MSDPGGIVDVVLRYGQAEREVGKAMVSRVVSIEAYEDAVSRREGARSALLDAIAEAAARSLGNVTKR